MPSPVNSTPSSPYGAPPAPGPSRLPENTPAAPSSTSAQPPVQNQAKARPTSIPVPRPRLSADQVSPASIAKLGAVKASGSANQQFLAETLLSHIQNGTLELGHPSLQSANRAQYGKTIVQENNRPANLAASFTVRQDGQLELRDAALRDTISKELVATITRQPSNNPMAAQASKPEAPMASGADHGDDVEFGREQIDLTRGGTEVPESSTLGKRALSVRSGSSGSSPPSGPADKRLDQRETPERQMAASKVAGVAGGQPAQEAASFISREDFKRNMQVAAALKVRGWSGGEVAEFKCTPAHIALLRDTHCVDTALLKELNVHIATRQSLGEMVGNSLFFIKNNRHVNQHTEHYPKDSLSSPIADNVRDWVGNERTVPFVNPAVKPKIDIETARKKLRSMASHEAWEKACAPVAKKLLEENLTNAQLGALTWKTLRDKDGVDENLFKSFRNKALNIHQYKKPTDLVFPKTPDGVSLTAYLHALCATHLSSTPAEAGPAEAAGALQ